jgi:hypothetical protein
MEGKTPNGLPQRQDDCMEVTRYFMRRQLSHGADMNKIVDFEKSKFKFYI